MIKKMIYLILFSIAVFSINALDLPPIPKDCFDDENYCYTYDVVYKDEIDKDVIRVKFIGQIDAYDDENAKDILEKFLDFDSWGEYICLLDDYGGNVKKALKVYPVVIDYCKDSGTELFEDKEAIVNEASYWTKAPFPLARLQVVERVFYFPVETAEGALLTWQFVGDPAFSEGKGIKYKTGMLSISYDEEEESYYVYAAVDILPDNELAVILNPGAEFAAQSIGFLFSGMFD